MKRTIRSLAFPAFGMLLFLSSTVQGEWQKLSDFPSRPPSSVRDSLRSLPIPASFVGTGLPPVASAFPFPPSHFEDTVVIEYKGRIKEIIDQKCYDCHSAKGDDADAKEALLWDELPKLNPTDQVYTLDAIAEAVKNGDMPPFSYAFWKASNKLTDEEAKLLIEWSSKLSDRIYKEMD